MTITEMQQKKIELGFTNQILADNSGVPLGTVQKIMAGVTLAPRKKTLDALEKALVEGEKAKIGLETESVRSEAERKAAMKEKEETDHTLKQFSKDEIANADNLKDSSVIYSTSRRGYTIEDYLALPDDKRVELIDGTFYDMSAASHVHQMICFYLGKMLDEIIDEIKVSGIAVLSPVDVQLDGDEWTVVQPDVMLICDRRKFQNNGRIMGAPDLIIEVLSPSTQRKDKYLKYYKYAEAGVREYWIVDIDKRCVKVIDFEMDKPTKIYQFRDQIPVGIWGGSCLVDFGKITSKIDFLLEEPVDGI